MRIRTLKPDFWSHPVMGRLSADTRLLAIALLSLADDAGYFRADPVLVRAACMPFNEDSMSIHAALETLEKHGWIQTSEHPEQGRIGRVVNFTKHQNICRPSPSKLEPYWITENSLNPQRALTEPSLLEQGTGNREQGTGNLLLSEAEQLTAQASGQIFDQFWKAYPNKVGKLQAKAAWDLQRRKHTLPPLDVILAALDRATASEQWQSEGGRFIPHPATWLRRGGWEDVPRGGPSSPTRQPGAEKKEGGGPPASFPTLLAAPPTWDWRTLAEQLYGTAPAHWADVPEAARQELTELHRAAKKKEGAA